ncbi:hypothetical protein D3C78_1002160 [compost metagenome]
MRTIYIPCLAVHHRIYIVSHCRIAVYPVDRPRFILNIEGFIDSAEKLQVKTVLAAHVID